MNAWVTLLTQPDYLVGVRALHASLRRAGTAHPLVVMVTPDVDAAARAQLTAEGVLLRDVAPLHPGPDGGDADDPGAYAAARFAEVWTKLAVWGLVEFDRVVFLDADMVVLRGADELFDLDVAPDAVAACYACRCNTNRVASYPASWRPENCSYSYATSGGAADDEYFNAGFLVLRPDAGVHAALLARLAALTDLSAVPFAEQDLLNEHFAGSWHVLPHVYNALKTLPVQHPDVWDAEQVRVVHYIGDKPWERRTSPGDRYWNLEQLWWDVARELPGVADGVAAPA